MKKNNYNDLLCQLLCNIKHKDNEVNKNRSNNTTEVYTILQGKGADQVTHICRLLHQHLPDEAVDVPVRPLSEAQRIRKVIVELVETERQYVKDLNCLIERYLEPLKEETFLTSEDIEVLFGNIQEIMQFQRLFLQTMEDAVHLETGFSVFTDSQDFKDEELRRVLFSVAGSFRDYANHFKLYSSFCASHSKAQKLLLSEDNVALQEFLRARNPKQQHSATLESYLIKPIQRILKYPLLLKQLVELTSKQSGEHLHLREALQSMETVAEHINEMQKIYEEYGSVFDELLRSMKDQKRKFVDLNVGDLQMYGNVNWLNALDELGKIKKGTDVVTLLFVFKAGVVVLAQEVPKGKRRTRASHSWLSNGADISETTRFTCAVPVDELQVRPVMTSETADDRHGLWELVFARSEREGRPEKVFQFASSQAARRDFMRTILTTIRESVRRMNIPRDSFSVPAPAPVQPRPHLPHLRRPDSIGGLPGSVTGGRDERHSAHIEDSVDSILEEAGGGVDFTRSKTFTDLNQAQVVWESAGPLNYSYPSGSQSTLGSEASRGSTATARLLHTSSNPAQYAPGTRPNRDSLNSPVWKPRVPLRQEGAAYPPPSRLMVNSLYGNFAPGAVRVRPTLMTPPNSTGYNE